MSGDSNVKPLLFNNISEIEERESIAKSLLEIQSTANILAPQLSSLNQSPLFQLQGNSGLQYNFYNITAGDKLTDGAGANGNSNSTDSSSIIYYYEPKFYSIYLKYLDHLTATTTSSTNSTSSNSTLVDLTQHLFMICLEHLIPFSCWLRKSEEVSSWIKSILNDHEDFRPEVRNGVSMLIIYCFSTAKSKLYPKSNSFMILENEDIGLGIVNKTSLRIYNDPYNYLQFIKQCITGLIKAGIVPENEKSNRVSSFYLLNLFA
jgi:hypothetical protein